MATIRLVPSAYSVSSSNRVTVTSASNMYYNTDHTANYCSIRGRNSSSSTYYAFIRGFNFDDVPSNAQVTSFSIKIRCYRNSYLQQTTSYRPRLASSTSNNNVISNTTLESDVTTTSGGTVYTFPIPSTLTWATLKGYGSNFSIEVPLRSSGNSYPYLYVYGAEIEVTYSTETVHVTGVSLNKSTTTIEYGETETLVATVTPSNASDKSVSWSSGNTSVATVDSSGVVTAVGSGTAVITATTTDGGYTASCTVTVPQVVTTEYVLTDTLVPGKNYIIASGNSGSVYMMSNESGGSRLLKGIAATVTNNKINVTSSQEAKCSFECVQYTTGNEITTTLESNGKYLYSDSGTGLRFNTVTTLDRFWHYIGTKFWQFKSTTTNGYTDTSSEYKYYLELSGSNFTDNHLTSPSVENTTLPAMYLFTPASASTEALYFKSNGSWTQASHVYKKVNGSWVEQSDLSNVFTSGVNYVKGS